MTVRNSTRRLIVSLDFRDFAVDVPMSIAGSSGRSFSETLRLLGTAFPAVRCILLGGNTGYDPSDLGHLLHPDDYPEDGSVPMPLILDIAGCGMPLPNTFFHPSYWRQLVYLDMSNVPGSLKGIIKTGTFNQGALPHLRILKLRGRVLDDASLAPIAEHAKQRIWSLDLTSNKLTDSSVHALFYQCFGTDDLTAQPSHFEVEGKLAVVGDVPEETIPSLWRGWLSYIVESAASGTFSHPDRFLADAPVYDADNHSPPSVARLAGNEPLRSDRAKDVKLALAGGPGQMPLDWHHVWDTDICKLPVSLTHLYLSGNRDFTVEGVESIFRCSRGHIQHFDCASPTIPTGGLVPFTLTGILGRSHLFRPVMASNLRSLRVHHSLVTQIPTLSDPSRSPREALMYAETVLRERAETAYPLMIADLGPDWNPRLQSLTLAGLPRISAGPLIDKLIRFLVSAAEQEAAVRAQQAAVSLSRHGPTVLSGLRHLRLEFEPYPPQDGDLDGAFDSLDAKALLNANSSDAFSFFRETRTAVTTAAGTEAAAKKSYQLNDAGLCKDGERTAAGGDDGRGSGYGDENIGGANDNASRNTNVPRHSDCPGAGGSASPDHLHSRAGKDNVAQAKKSDRLSHYPLSGALDASSEYVRELLSLGDNSQTAINTTADNSTNAQQTIQLSVWVGSGQPGTNRAINGYMANLARPSLRANIRPATPDQVAAGVPVGACVYNAAWDAIAWLPPPDESKRHLPTAATSGAVNKGRHRLGSAVRPHRHPKDGVMVDVVDAIRQFRAETRSGKRNPGGWALQASRQDGRMYGENQQPVPRHWAGTLEILLAS
ncbi:leucine rich repeat domain containing protein [Sporothrix brasiliensis 5110]|uniref:Leucine rich repeat domain containing protein n=1 Tax=Sporothrix brasiliensis 5110 TaxID=1398154 RepID=A0A0C2IVH9_9PEZI|nr:leucine rich repeat domain containing protein [Sporothrix brasiliensis 5110]KIH90790.1 leucine rich repeat domain containing protein [Sporothrix brasiliensis 5110]